MKHFITNNSAIFMSLGIMALYFIGYLQFGADPPRIVFGSLLIGSLATLLLILTGPAVAAFKRGVRDGGDNILISQWGMFSTLLMYLTYTQFAVSARIWGWFTQEQLADLPIAGVFITMMFIVCGFTILAPINTTLEIEKPSMARWLIAVATGSAVAATLATLSFLGIVEYFTGG